MTIEVQKPAATMTTQSIEEDEPVISGPHYFFEGSFIIEYLKPRPSRNASVLMRATYKHDHPLTKKGKGHPQAPPLHLHFQQIETFCVLQGQIGTTTTWSCVDTIHTPQITGEAHPFDVKTWMPHRFWPVADATEDAVMLVWAHPNGDDLDSQMDRLFFQQLFYYIDDVHTGKEKLSLLQIMLTQHVSATALIMFPRAWFLGPLRWWIPYQFQALCAKIATWQGMTPLQAKYMTEPEWEMVQSKVAKGKSKKKSP